ncbi:MAG: VWA domain-containing protein [Gemmataceae bacterium]|nr:VWA domain-containing protein [Gemmataceae bacterium]
MAAGVVLLLAAAAEVLHYRRVLRAAPLAFGPSRRWLALAAVAPALRTLAAGAAAWGLTVLALLPPKAHKLNEVLPGEYRHLVLVLDVSRSMTVEDAGREGKQPRRERAADLIQSFFERVEAERYKTTVVAFAKEAKPVVVDTVDREVVRNILSDLPLRHAFKPGDTDLFAGLEEAARVAKPWPPGSAVLVMVTDGDTVPATGMPKMPASIGANVVIVGVGNPTAGKSLGGHTTRQDVSTLRQVANRLNGVYHDGNDKHLTTELVSRIDERTRPKDADRWAAREYALLGVGAGCGVLAVLPAVLGLVGTGWSPGRRPRASRGGPNNVPHSV